MNVPCMGSDTPTRTRGSAAVWIARREPDPFGSLLAVGLTAPLSLQAFVNMAVVTGLVPTKGLPLPFLSYGGTSMVVSLAAVGVLMALGRRSGMR